MAGCPNCETAGPYERPYHLRWGGPLFQDRAIHRCELCELGYCSPMPLADDLDDYYATGGFDSGGRAGVADTSRASRPVLRARAQCDFVTRATGRIPSSWLDLGAGYGALVDEARRRGARTAAVEPTPSRNDELRNRGHETFSNQDDAPGGWDVVSFSHVLEHVTDPVSFVRDAAKLVASDGAIYCEVPNAGPGWNGLDEPHVLFFTKRSLVSTMERAGLEVLAVAEAGPRAQPRFKPAHRAWKLAKQVNPPAAVTRFDGEFRSGDGQGRVYLRCVATPR